MKNMYRAILLALPLAVAACGQSGTEPTSAKTSAQPAAQADVSSRAAAPSAESGLPTSQQPSIEAARKYAHGFDTGNLMSQRLVYVFFDPQCPHCGEFWKETKSLEKEAHFIWVPIAILNGESLKQGAAILSAAKPVDTMTAHEDQLAAHTGGLQAPDATPSLKAIIANNTRLLESFGATGVPFVLGVNQQTGKTYSNSGGMPAAELAKNLGWTPAPSNVAFEMRNAGAPVAIHATDAN